jgi:non-specific serine/threonine protein kinase
MGLGKTVQVIALLMRRKELGLSKKPSLLVVPASLIGNWRAEVGKFAPGLRLKVAHASVTGREEVDALLREPERVLRGVLALRVEPLLLALLPLVVPLLLLR